MNVWDVPAVQVAFDLPEWQARLAPQTGEHVIRSLLPRLRFSGEEDLQQLAPQRLGERRLVVVGKTLTDAKFTSTEVTNHKG